MHTHFISLLNGDFTIAHRGASHLSLFPDLLKSMNTQYVYIFLCVFKLNYTPIFIYKDSDEECDVRMNTKCLRFVTTGIIHLEMLFTLRIAYLRMIKIWWPPFLGVLVADGLVWKTSINSIFIYSYLKMKRGFVNKWGRCKFETLA